MRPVILGLCAINTSLVLEYTVYICCFENKFLLNCKINSKKRILNIIQSEYSPQALPTFDNSIGFPFLDFLGQKGYISRLNGCHMAWKIHSITFDFFEFHICGNKRFK